MIERDKLYFFVQEKEQCFYFEDGVFAETSSRYLINQQGVYLLKPDGKQDITLGVRERYFLLLWDSDLSPGMRPLFELARTLKLKLDEFKWENRPIIFQPNLREGFYLSNSEKQRNY